ncbi:MAG: helix-turn-helix domain protein [Clostridiaceae bacterium]|jgi:tetratricopeptide (TPR) repeat protein|nr:helix-turn-helix domain protein [Clostridiaceae bacterium]
MDFLTPGQKVRCFRKQLKMSQEDLASNALTRPYISMIETGKRDLSRNVARILTAKFNERAKELKVDLSANFDFIMRTPYEDALKYCSEKLDNAVLENDLNEILEISVKFNLESIKAKTYYKLGNLYFDNHNYINAFDNYDMALDSYRNSGQHNMESFLYNCLGKCKINLLQYDEALIYYKRANYYSTIYGDTEILKLSTYNMALCYKKLDDIDMAIDYIDKCLSICNKYNDFKEYVCANILKANCYEFEENINDALSIYNSLTTQFSDRQDPLLGIIYNNLGLLHVKMNNYVRSIEYFNDAEKIRMKNDMLNLSHTIIEKSTVYINQGFYNEAITLIELGLDMASKNNDIQYLIRGKYLLVDIYNAINDNSKIEETYLSILKLLRNTEGNYNEILKVYNSLTILYLKENNLNKVKDCLLMSQNFIEKCYI